MRKITSLLMLVIVAVCANAQIFYKVEGNGLKEPSYIFGTHHLAPLSVYSDSEAAQAGFKAAKKIIGEIDMSAMSDMATGLMMQQKMTAPADSTLSKLLGDEKMEEYSEKFAKVIPGAQLSMFDAMKPMMISNIISLTLISQNLPGYNPQEQLDSWFQEQGRLEGKEVGAFETVSEQMDALFCKMPIRSQLKALTEMLDDPSKTMTQVNELNTAYLAKDLGKLLEISEAENDDPEARAFQEIILKNRNANWLKQLPGILAEGPVFIAVGALHLPGSEGIIEGLRQQGYTVTPQ